MRINLIIFFIMTMVLVSCTSSRKLNQIVVDEKTQTEILIGNCNLAGLQSETFSSYYYSEYDKYMIEDDNVTEIAKSINDCDIIVVLGTWCHDSHEQVPRFMRVLDAASFKGEPDFICVDTKKLAGDVDLSGLDIKRVPTFIIYKDEQEIGRIIETPSGSLESDLLSILKQ